MTELKSLNKHFSVYFVLSHQARTTFVALLFLPQEGREKAELSPTSIFLLSLVPSQSLHRHSVSHSIWLLIQI